MFTFNLGQWARFASFFVFMLFTAAVGPVMAQTAPAVCTQGGTVTLPVSGAQPYIFTTITIQPGQSATLTVSGTGTFASGFIPGPGGGSVTTYPNTGTTPITTQAAIIVETAGTFTWSLTGGTCAPPATAPLLDRWALWLLAGVFLLLGAAWRSARLSNS